MRSSCGGTFGSGIADSMASGEEKGECEIKVEGETEQEDDDDEDDEDNEDDGDEESCV